jgi:hypothetical protein
VADGTPDPAKVRQRIREELSALAVTEAVAAELSSLADEKWREVTRDQGRIRGWFAYLGVPPEDAPSGREAAEKLLQAMEARDA